MASGCQASGRYHLQGSLASTFIGPKKRRAVLLVIDYWNTWNLRTRRILRVRKIIFLLLIVIVEMTASMAQHWVGSPRRILIWIREASKVNLLIARQRVVMLLLSKKTKNIVTRIWVISNAMLITKRANMLASPLAKRQKISIGLGNFYIKN